MYIMGFLIVQLYCSRKLHTSRDVFCDNDNTW